MAPPPHDNPPAAAAAGPDACPVDHKSREAWLSQARSAAAAAAAAEPAVPPNHPPARDAAADSCPVDHHAREAWLRQAREASAAAGATATTPSPAVPPPAAAGGSSWTTSLTSWLPSFSSSSSSSSSSSRSTPPPPQAATPAATLSQTRVVSTIPRAGLDDARAAAGSGGGSSHAPANREQETGADAKSGNWIYPSEKMFFEAMKRKGHDPQAPDMRSVVPIHNAVNERAWAEIKGWEGPYVEGTGCQGPRLTSFSGLSTKLSPKARFNTLLGYSAPFDRHDWIVDRCGKEIEYVIDFYAGRPAPDGKPSFYLDVRPKLNSWEGVKMRAMRGLGVM